MSFAACLPVILASEGGFVDDPADPGGATNLGITLATLSGWLGRPATIAQVQALTPQTVAPIYQADFWNVARCDAWKPGVDLLAFDEAVNEGPGRAIRTVQQALGVTPDGDVGPATLAASQSAAASAVIARMAAIRTAYYRALPGFPRFGAGWLARVQHTAALAQQMAAAA